NCVTYPAPGDRYTHHKGAFGGEVGGDDGHAGDEQASNSQADADALSKYDLVVIFPQACHQHPKDHHEGAGSDQGAKIASVKDWAGQDTDEEEEETLDGANPGDGGVGLVGKKSGGVVFLVYTEGIDDAPIGQSVLGKPAGKTVGDGETDSLPCVKEDEMSTEDLEIGLEAAIRRVRLSSRNRLLLLWGREVVVTVWE
ncbi:MAG: hypothetical protein Q9225_006705, partial [Loekoesia sp. 1 TL-2023]